MVPRILLYTELPPALFVTHIKDIKVGCLKNKKNVVESKSAVYQKSQKQLHCTPHTLTVY